MLNFFVLFLLRCVFVLPFSSLDRQMATTPRWVWLRSHICVSFSLLHHFASLPLVGPVGRREEKEDKNSLFPSTIARARISFLC